MKYRLSAILVSLTTFVMYTASASAQTTGDQIGHEVATTISRALLEILIRILSGTI